MLRILLLAAFLVVTAGCTPAKKITPSPDPDTRFQPYSVKNPGTTTEDKYTISNNLSETVSAVKNVKRASVAILGTTAYIGLELKSGLSKSQIGTVKTQSAAEVRATEPRIRSIWVTTNTNAIRKIDKVRADFGKNRPSSEYSRELREVLDQSELVR